MTFSTHFFRNFERFRKLKHLNIELAFEKLSSTLFEKTQVIRGNIPLFHPQNIETNLSSLSLLLQFVYNFWKFLWLRKLKTLKTEQTRYAVCYFEVGCCSILLQTHVKNDPDESEVK